MKLAKKHLKNTAIPSSKKKRMAKCIAAFATTCLISVNCLPLVAVQAAVQGIAASASQMRLSSKWEVKRENNLNWKFSEDGSEKIEIKSIDSNIWGNQNTTQNLFLTDINSDDQENYAVSVKITGRPETDYHMMGLMVYGDDDNFVQLANKSFDKKIRMASEKNATLTEGTKDKAPDAPTQDEYYLKMIKEGNEYSGYLSIDGTTWTLVDKVTNDALGKTQKLGLFVASGNATKWIGFSEPKVNDQIINFFAGEEEPQVTIESLETVLLETAVGVIPTLPNTVNATYSDKSKKVVPVTWERKLTQEDVSSERTVVIQGTVPDTDLKATAEISVKNMPLFDETEWSGKPEIYSVGVETSVANYFAYQDEQTALAGNPENSDFYKPLNGTWKFNFAENPAKRARAFQGTEFDDSAWDDIQVPSSWSNLRNEDGTLKYDHPIYTNTTYMWTGNDRPNASSADAPSYVNPVGSYRTEFEIPENWDQREVFLNFDGVESGYYVWVNGNQVGYAEDTFTKKVFRITDYLQPGKNVLAVQVYKWCDGSWQEDQDMLYHGGIYRDVYLTSKHGQAEIKDFEIVTNLDETYTDSTLEIYTDLRTFVNDFSKELKLEAKLLDGETVVETLSKEITASADLDDILLSTDIKNPHKWSAEDPYLYDLVLTLSDESGVLETTSVKVGFREMEIKGQGTNQAQMYINGKPIYVKGVNRQELNEVTGRYVTKEQMEEEFQMMKKFNINALRMGHYPNSPYVYDLCDRYGIYIMSEANVETHGAQGAVSGNRAWGPAVMARNTTMFEQQKNHASVVFWSVGNEQGAYDINKAAYYKLKEIDRSKRVVNYDQDQTHSDIISQGYRTPDELPGFAGRGKPYLMLEYAHAMGNSVGNLKELWNVIEDPRYPSVQGGFIWDWVDQAMESPVKYIKNQANHDSNNYIVSGELMTGEFSSASNPDRAMRGYVELLGSSTTNIADGFTFEASIKPDVATGTTMTILSKGNDAELKLANNVNLQFTVGGKTISYQIPAQQIKDSNWHKVAATFGNNSLKLYYDGVLVAQDTLSSSFVNNSHSLMVGNNVQNQNRGFYGRIDNVHVYTRALSENDLKKNRDSSDGGVAFWFDMNGEFVGKTGETYFAYGGDWMDFGNQSNFCANGLLLPDKTIEPELYEVKKVYQNADILLVDNNGIVSIENKSLFTNFSQYDLYWELKENNIVVQSDVLNVDIEPGQTKNVTIPLEAFEKAQGKEYWLTVQFKLKNDTDWAKSGHAVIEEQLLLNENSVGNAKNIQIESLDGMNYTETATDITITGDKFNIEINKNTGELSSFISEGVQLLDRGPVPNYYRAPVDNDRGASIYGQIERWKNAGEFRTVSNVSISADAEKKMISVFVSGNLPVGSSKYNMTYYIYGDGTIQVDNTLMPAGIGSDIVPVMGNMLRIPQQFNQVAWYGKGPFNTTSDRKTGAKVDVYRSTAEDMFFPHARPQETGGRDDIRWMALTNEDGVGLLVSSKQSFSGSAMRYTPSELSSKMHPYQLQKEDNIVLRVDYGQVGVGGAHSWGSWPIEKYLMRANKNYSYSYSISPLTELNVEKAMDKSRTVYEANVGTIAANISEIAPPTLTDTALSLPTVPEGFTVRIASSDKLGVIGLDGKINFPLEETTVTLVLEVEKLSDGSTANTKPIQVTVPKRTIYYPWQIIRENPLTWKLLDDNSQLSIKQTLGSHWDNKDPKGNNMFVINPTLQDAENFSVTVKMTGKTTTGYEQAGLLIYKDDNNFVQVARMHKAGNPLIAMNTRSGSNVADISGSKKAPSDETIYLKITKSGNAYNSFYSLDGLNWESTGSCTNANLVNAKIGVFSSSEDVDNWFTFEEVRVNDKKIPFVQKESPLDSKWTIVRENDALWSIPNPDKNQLQLKPFSGTLEGIDVGSSRNLILTAGPSGVETSNYSTTVKLTGKPTTNKEAAGIIFYGTDDRYLRIQRERADDNNIIRFVSEDTGTVTHLSVPDNNGESVYLRLDRNTQPIDSFTAYYSTDGKTWETVGTLQNTAVYGNMIGVVADGATTQNTYTFEQFMMNNKLISFIKTDDVPITDISLNHTELSLNVGDIYPSLMASILPENTTEDKTIVWNSNNSAVTVDEHGILTANAVGTAIIRATSKANPSIFAECTVTVSSKVEEELKTEILEYVIELAETAKQNGALEGVIQIVKERFEAALTNANTVYANAISQNPTVTQEEIDGAWIALMKAMQYLEFKADKTNLIKVIEIAKTYEAKKHKYIPSTYTPFETALEAARLVLEDENALNDEIDPAWRALISAIAGLKLIPNKEELQDWIMKAQAIDTDQYTAASVAVMTNALANAQAILNDKEATSEKVDAAKEALRNSLGGLVSITADKQDTVDGTIVTGTNGAANSNNTKTGDNTPIELALVLAGLSGLAIFGIKKKKQQ